MKILQIFPYLPTPATFGGAKRTYHILKHLAGHHDVTVAGFSEYGDPDLFKQTFPELKGKMHFLNRNKIEAFRIQQIKSLFTPHSYWYNWSQSDEFQKVLNGLFEENDFDFVLTEFSSMGHFDLHTQAIRILDAHNVEYDNFRRMSQLKWSLPRKFFYNREYEKCYREEIEIFKKQDAIFTTSDRDSELIQKDVKGIPHYTIPNGVDMTYFKSTQSDVEPNSIVFTGAMSYLPNQDAMIFFVETILPIIRKSVPDVKLYIVGSNPPEVIKNYQSDSITVTGFVDDVRPYIDEASVYVVPLNMGSGTRLKIPEAMSMRKPIVTTSIGCEGLDVEDNTHALIRDTPLGFAEAVVELMQNPDLRSRISENGYELARQKYDWDVIGESIENAFRSLKNEYIWA
jgi:polysaccharide biosynthesis protein PslH